MYKIGKQKDQSVKKDDVNVLQSQIKKVQDGIYSKVYNINQGGCIHFAYYLSKRLNKLKIPHKVFFGNYSRIDLRYEYFESVSHVMIYIDGIGYIDGTDILVTSPYHSYKRCVKVSEKKLNTMRNYYEWNNWYDLKQNSTVSKLINKYITNA